MAKEMVKYLWNVLFIGWTKGSNKIRKVRSCLNFVWRLLLVVISNNSHCWMLNTEALIMHPCVLLCQWEFTWTPFPTQEQTNYQKSKKQPNNQPTKQSTNLSANQPASQPASQPTNQPTNWPTNWVTDRATEQLTNQPTNQPTKNT